MGRKKHDHWWKHVTEDENGRKWTCKYCNRTFSGGSSRIEAHLIGKGVGGGIRRCSDYHGNEGVHNNMASTSSNPPEVVINTIDVTHNQGK
jgi:N-methylhydantoinase B/oxoprolinase/acetone carboxylase alpha subunit